MRKVGFVSNDKQDKEADIGVPGRRMRKELFILGMLLTLLVSSVAALVEYVDSTPRYEGSTNWAGYAPVSGTAIRTVKGVFDVPKAGCRKNWSAGLWAGLGGMSERTV